MRKVFAVAGIVLFLGAFVGAWLWMARSILSSLNESKQRVSEIQNVPAVADPVQDEATVDTESAPVDDSWRPPEKKFFEEFTDQDIRKGQVKWQEPEDMGDLGWTSKDVYAGKYQKENEYSGGVRYVKVGTVTEGKYKGADVIVVSDWFYGDYPRDNSPVLTHYLRLGDKVISLPYADVSNGEEVRMVTKDGWTVGEFMPEDEALAIRPPNMSIDKETRIEDLAVYGKEIRGANEREVFVQDEYADQAFFLDEGLKPVFMHPELGQVWMRDMTAKRESHVDLNAYRSRDYDAKPDKNGKYPVVKRYYDPVVAGGFYVRRPDGIVETYRLKLDIFTEFDREALLLAKWKDGTINTAHYEEYPSGCGTSAYAYDKTAEVDLKKDLKAVGKTDQGDNLYEYNDSHPALKAYFKDTYLPSLRFNPGFGKDSVDLSKENENTLWKEFLGKHAIVFWIDPFGRTLAFYNTDTFPLAECGKPVVYLYPEKTTDVSVKVFPSEGVSISDPAYGDGWNVTARPDGTLTNKADGKDYPYLFWEGGSDVLYQTPEQGFVTSKESLGTFLDEKLAQLGLSSKEAADFKEFWIPKMNESGKPYYFITFLSQQQIDRLAPLRIEPKPDTVIRVMMDYAGLDAWKNVKGYTLHTPERRGFTAVEWGGRLQ